MVNKDDHKVLCNSVDIRRDAVKILLGNAAVNRLSVARVHRVIISHQRPRARVVKIGFFLHRAALSDLRYTVAR